MSGRTKQQYEIGIKRKDGLVQWERGYGTAKSQLDTARGYSISDDIDFVAVTETRTGKRLANFRAGKELSA